MLKATEKAQILEGKHLRKSLKTKCAHGAKQGEQMKLSECEQLTS